MRIEPATVIDISAVARRMRERDFLEFRAVLPADTRDLIARALADRYAGRDDIFCAWTGTDQVAIGAASEVRPGVVGVLFFATGMFGKIVRPLTKFIRADLFPSIRAAGAHRIEAITLDGYAASERWLESLGLEREAAITGYGRHGETFNLFAWVSDAVRAPRH